MQLSNKRMYGHMANFLRIDRMMADRKISLNELAEKVGTASLAICWNLRGIKGNLPV